MHMSIRLMLVGFATSALALSAVPAMADNWGTCLLPIDEGEAGCHPDAGSHLYCFHSSLTTGLQGNVDFVTDDALNDRTQATTVKQSSCDTSGTTQTDVRWFTDDLPNTTQGRATCAIMTANDICDRNDVELDDVQINAVNPNDEAGQDKAVCHELGHTVGLRHATYDCMSAEIPDLADPYYRTYSPHHITHIDAWF